MASWKEIVTKSPADSTISSVSIQQATGFNGVMAAENGGLGVSTLALGTGLMIKTGSDSYSTIGAVAGEVIGTSGGGTLGSVDIASSHTHSDLIHTDSDTSVNGDLAINGELSITTLNVGSVHVTESNDNFITVNADGSGGTGGLEMYLSGTPGNNAKIQWNNTNGAWEMGNETNGLVNVAGVVERAADAWSDTSSSAFKTGMLGLDTTTGSCYIFLP
tara:strand:- start:545 stop:1198 length:654 start_codon:yes stop_codon:yes gene_type:complete